uniref:DUF4220 domain-containing protein n=1 Tax=Oryza rufipogon TaxID=4529 RepID=A0A0E0Q6H5_ORYRU
MGISNALQWWEEWQLRVLVLGSLAFQYFLFITASRHKFPIRSYLRSFIWFVYLGSDALAIYALATLFNRHKKQDVGHTHNNDVLEILWAPILLIHLGGQDSITAYNIEDNELWMRHVLTALSQITVAIYVFCKSWPGGDRRLLQSAILLFVPGILKCLEKPWALNRASINSLVSFDEKVRRTINRQGKQIDSIEDFVRSARGFFCGNDHLEKPSRSADFTPDELFVDLASPCTDNRVRKLMSFSALCGDEAYYLLQNNLSDTFDLLYTKEKMSLKTPPTEELETGLHHFVELYKQLNYTLFSSLSEFFGTVIRELAMFLPFTAIGLFHQSNRKSYNDKDVKVTYALLCCTAVIEFYNPFVKVFTSVTLNQRSSSVSKLSQRPRQRYLYQHQDDMVSQYNLLGYFVRNKKHSTIMNFVGFFGCKNYLDRRWRMKSCFSSRSITNVVLGHVKRWWKDHITDVFTYRMFNDIRGQWSLKVEGCFQGLGWSLEGAFDESVLLWHLATDLCFYHISPSHGREHATTMCIERSSGLNNRCPTWCEKSIHHKNAVQCREMSNYMTYLLFVNPEMLMPGTRRNLFTDAYNELKGVVKEKNPPLDERELAERIIAEVQQQLEEITGEDKSPSSKRGLIEDAWSIAEELLKLEDDEKMWRVIEGVWVEMLCFSAARCRGYLHAKGLGTGVEFLSYVWLLLHYMGMETLAEKLARGDLQNRGHSGNLRTFHVRESSGEEQVAGPSTSYANGDNGDQHVVAPFSEDGFTLAGDENV